MPKNYNKRHKSRLRKPHEKKPIRPGVKSMRGQPEMYDELKKIVSISITPTAKAGLAELSASRNISLSELIERIGRQIINLSADEVIDYQILLRHESNDNNYLDPK